MNGQRETAPARLRRAATVLASALLADAVSVAPSAADDTEVFFGQGTGNGEINPNVLFVLDTSHSMNSLDPGQSASRADRLKRALYRILDKSENLNVGLMRFNGSYGGAAVLHPVKSLDEVVCAEDCNVVELTRRISSGVDDVEEHLDDGYVEHAGSGRGRILSMSHSGAGQAQMVGYRFRDLGIPQGARIISARLRFTAVRDRAGTTRLRVSGKPAT